MKVIAVVKVAVVENRRMSKVYPTLKKISAIFIFICLFLLVLFSTIFMNVNNLSFFEKQYTKLNIEKTTQMTKTEYRDATKNLLDYINKNKPITATMKQDDKTIAVFNNKEITHMVDVKNLYSSTKTFVMLLLFVMFCLLSMVYIKFRKEALKMIKYYKQALMIFSGVLLLIIVIAVANFDYFWDSFHRLLFTNELWLLDPNVDRMINMYPLELFHALVFKIIGWFVLWMALITLAVSIMKKKSLSS